MGTFNFLVLSISLVWLAMGSSVPSDSFLLDALAFLGVIFCGGGLVASIIPEKPKPRR